MTDIKPGQCYMSQFSKVELPVRIERIIPNRWSAIQGAVFRGPVNDNETGTRSD